MKVKAGKGWNHWFVSEPPDDPDLFYMLVVVDPQDWQKDRYFAGCTSSLSNGECILS